MGTWLEFTDYEVVRRFYGVDYVFICSECGSILHRTPMRFCPSCKAEMTKVKWRRNLKNDKTD